MKKRACLDCEYWETDDLQNANLETVGDCKFYPPTIIPVGRDFKVHSPQTQGKDWCGQYVKRANQKPADKPATGGQRKVQTGYRPM
jgi:hypothetical protein